MFMFLLQATLHLTTPIELKIIKGCRFLSIITSIYLQTEKGHTKSVDKSYLVLALPLLGNCDSQVEAKTANVLQPRKG
jgi:hypothetical protein